MFPGEVGANAFVLKNTRPARRLPPWLAQEFDVAWRLRRRRHRRRTKDPKKLLRYLHKTTHRGATTPPRRRGHPAATAPPVVTALHLAAPPGRRTSLLSPVFAGSAIAVTVSFVTAPRVTSRRRACACARMT